MSGPWEQYAKQVTTPEPADGPWSAYGGDSDLTEGQQRALQAETTSQSGALHDTPTGRSPDPAFQKPIEGRGAGFFANLKSGIATEPKTKLRLLAESMFPDDPRAYRRFGYRDGNPVFINREGRLERADTGAASRIGSAIASTPELVGGVIGSFATGNPFTGSIVGSVGGTGIKQALSGILFDEPQTISGNLGGLAEEAVVSTAGGALGKGAALSINRAAVRGADKYDTAAAKDTIARIKDSTGIELDYAQAGNIRQLRDLKKWASKYPSDAQEIIEALDTQQADQIATALRDKLMPKISAKTDNTEMAQSGIDGARAAIQLAKQRRMLETRPLYQQADSDVLEQSAADRLMADQYIEQRLKGVLGNKLYASEFDDLGIDKATRGNTVKAWDLVLRDINDAREAAIRNGENNKARLLGQKAKKLEEELSQASPKYAEARQAWANASRAYVDPLEKGTVGVLAKIDSPTIARDAARILDGDILSNPRTAAQVRGALTEAGNEDAWNDLVRLSLEKAFQKASKETQGGDVVNMAGKFRQAVIGTPQQKLAMDVALGKSVHPLFGDLMDAMQMIAKEQRGRGGSDTAFNQAITKQQKGGAISSMARTAMSPFNTAVDMIDERMLENNARSIADALTDPQKIARLKELRALKPSQERAIAMLSAAGIGSFALGSGLDAANAPVDAMPGSDREVRQSR